MALTSGATLAGDCAADCCAPNGSSAAAVVFSRRSDLPDATLL
jgi:hypothetical protein